MNMSLLYQLPAPQTLPKSAPQNVPQRNCFIFSPVGKGFATEAAKAGLMFIFKELNANKVALTCDEDNTGSYRVAERCGFIREGHLRREAKRSDSRLVGKLYYGMLKEEFERLNLS